MLLEKLEPRNVFHWFEELSAIPHGSGNTKAVADWCVRFAEERGLEHHRDQTNNIILIKKATPGYENAAPVIVQGHLDMVCEKEPDCEKDMEREGLDLRTDGVSVWADGTTLGGDDGIAVAIALALLDADELPAPQLEVVLTSDEEVGMLGAAALDVSPLTGRKMLNLDAEEEGVFTVSCAGGVVAECRLPLHREPFFGETWKLTVSGLRGGHSGEMINKGRANAVMLLGRILRAAAGRTELRLIGAAGGLKDNAIPTSAAATVSVSDGTAAVRKFAETFAALLKVEYRMADPDLTVKAEPCACDELPMDGETTRRALGMLACLPNGVQEMSMDIPGLTQTSLNLGILKTNETVLMAEFCVRSSLTTQKEMLMDRLACLTELLGGNVTFSGDYPSWAYRPDSPLRDLMVQVFREQYGREPEITAIHGGVECGLFSNQLPGLDCVSFGPDIADIHTPRERMNVASTARIWSFVTEILQRSH